MTFRRIYQCALFELFDALRSRRALVLIMLYLIVSSLTMGGTITVLGKMEDQLAETLGVERVEGKSGVVSAALWKSKPFQGIVRHAVHNAPVYDDIVGRHPAELLYAWLVFLFVPLMTVLFSSNRIAGDIRSGAVRYMLTRVTRLEWTLGKYFGNAVLILVGLLVGAVAAWIVAVWKLSGADLTALLPAMVVWSLKAWLLSLAWLGLALGVSHCFRTPAKADGMALVALFFCSVAPKVLWLLSLADGFAGRLSILAQFFPSSSEDALWRASFGPVAMAGVWLFALGLLYLALGHAWFVRRDVR